LWNYANIDTRLTVKHFYILTSIALVYYMIAIGDSNTPNSDW